MKPFLTGVAISAGSLALAFAGATVAAADSGDGKLACNRYEICFSKHWDNYRYQKHFWRAGQHGGYVWFDTAKRESTNQPIRNSASAIANRDGSCDVRVVNDRGVLPDSTILIGKVPHKVSWVFLGDINDANDRHERVNC